MKKLILIIATMISLTAKAQTSVYHPFPDSNAVWRESYLLFDGISTQYFHEYQYYINGDTTININA